MPFCCTHACRQLYIKCRRAITQHREIQTCTMWRAIWRPLTRTRVLASAASAAAFGPPADAALTLPPAWCHQSHQHLQTFPAREFSSRPGGARPASAGLSPQKCKLGTIPRNTVVADSLQWPQISHARCGCVSSRKGGEVSSTCNHKALADDVDGDNDRLSDHGGDRARKGAGHAGFGSLIWRPPGQGGRVQAPGFCRLQRCEVHLRA